MSMIAVQTPSHQLSVKTVPTAAKLHWAGSIRQALELLASLRLTVILFSLAMVLVFCGTLAQVDMGMWTADTDVSVWSANDVEIGAIESPAAGRHENAKEGTAVRITQNRV
jgi:hypothetical protein